MTKLFSMKSLAFAGVAAFALTLAAAPKADAAATVDFSDLSKVTVSGEQLKTTDDGSVIYYQLVKNEEESNDSKKCNPSKYVAIADEKLGYYNLSDLAGKGKYLVISTDGKTKTTGIMLEKAPKVKIKYNGSGLEVTINNKEATLASGSSIKATTEEGTYTITNAEDDLIKSASVIGATLNMTVQKEGIGTAPTTAKVKITAKAKAPKVSLKLDATSAFTWKLGKGQQYKVSGGTTLGWTDAPNGASSWAELLKGSSDTSIVTGDAITKDINIEVRVGKTEKKAASAITLIPLKKSAASPTSGAVRIKTTNGVFTTDSKGNRKLKTATSAALEAYVDNIQYSTDGGKKWKKVGNVNNKGKAVNLKVNKTDPSKSETSILVRVAGQSKTAMVLPSLNTGIAWNTESGEATMTPFDGTAPETFNPVEK